ncbi:Vitamin B12 transporter BtuB [Pseudoalteromonas holothuriae]|uniref:Vitamin B12 transporter BtuB n=1 Tax=Pseudoalteromonas holothuriae TaxID=2963714 RepID=A0ABM9GL89_9GAMM|nr:TonB-dependent receptor [Pseudoalteromonas sp. CIP111951]CAH9064448.1 Vitamin B12 transporter BtuB [Pseudoalteromonas sp. CIP111951]
MTYKLSPVRNAVTTALLMMSGTSFASDGVNEAANKKETKEIERVAVTGSRLIRPELTSSLPITTVTSEDIALSGLTSITDVFTRLPAMNGNQVSIDENFGADARNNDGRQKIQLRGLGYARTLNLLDGVRMAADTDGSVDISIIPTTMLKRVDIKKGSASAIYGSDAIAGVVNYQLLKDFEGIKLSASTGISEYNDAPTHTFSFVGGTSFDNGGITLGIEAKKVGTYNRGSRSFYHPDRSDQKISGIFEGTNFLSIYGPDGNFTYSDCDPDTATATYYMMHRSNGSDGNNLSDFAPYSATYKGQAGQAGQACWELEEIAQEEAEKKYKEAHGYNYQSETLDASKRTEYSVLLNSYYNFTNTLEGTFQLLYADKENYAQEAAAVVSGLFVSKDNEFNPFGRDVRMNRRLTNLNKRNTTTVTTPLHVRFGLSGELFENWTWSSDLVHSTYEAKTAYPAALNRTLLQNSLSGPDVCLAEDNCSALNPFLDLENLNSELLDAIMIEGIWTEHKATTNTFNLSAVGEVYELPAGSIQVALGVEYRTEEASNKFDDVRGKYKLVGNLAQEESNIPPKRKIKEAYIETSIPLLEDAYFAKHLSIELALRYSNYSDSGSSSTPSVNIYWKPVDELMVRANYSEGFRAPTLFDLYRGREVLTDRWYSNSSDPCSNTGWEQLPLCKSFGARVAEAEPYQWSFEMGGNENLNPETSTSRNLGLVWTPEYIKGLSATLDFWKVDIENAPERLTRVMLRENARTNGELFADLIQRNPTTHVLEHYKSIIINIGKTRSQGYDLDLNYAFSETALGQFTVNYSLAEITRGENQYLGDDEWTPSIGRYNNLETKQSFGIFWNKGNWSSSFTVAYGSKAFNSDEDDILDLTDIPEKDQYREAREYAKSWSPSYDLKTFTLGYDAQAYGRFNLTVQNPFGETPPFYDIARGYDRGPNPRGRYFTLSWFKEF